MSDEVPAVTVHTHILVDRDGGYSICVKSISPDLDWAEILSSIAFGGGSEKKL